MVTVKTFNQNGKVVYQFAGVVDESFDVSAALKDAQAPLFFELSGIKRMNSTGVKKWMQFFNALQAEGKRCIFARVSPTLVEQLNLISNFSCGAEVVSVVLPFTCQACGSSESISKDKKALVGVDLDHVDWPCSSCQAPKLEFDDLADEYLRFWK